MLKGMLNKKTPPQEVIDENIGDTTLDGLGKKIIQGKPIIGGQGFGDGQNGYGKIKPQGADFSHGVALYLENISVWFDSFRALNDLSLYINEGELRCIIGPNGAGKTTLMDVITGKTRPTEGTAFFGQTYDLTKMSTEQIAEAGIGRKFQKPTVFENFTVMENLLLALPKNKRVRGSLFKKLSGESQATLDSTLEQIRLKDYVHKPAGLLSHGQKQWLEIGMLLMQRPTLILLDEPVAGMTDAETERTAELCLELKKNHTLMVVEHDMSFIDTISEKVTVLAQGAILAEGTLAEVQANEEVIEKYLGR